MPSALNMFRKKWEMSYIYCKMISDYIRFYPNSARFPDINEKKVNTHFQPASLAQYFPSLVILNKYTK